MVPRTQHFELTPSQTLQTAQASLASELQPAILTLLSRTELYIAKQERRQQALVARSELLEGRLEGNVGGGGGELRKKGRGERLVGGVGLGLGLAGEKKGSEEKALRYVFFCLCFRGGVFLVWGLKGMSGERVILIGRID